MLVILLLQGSLVCLSQNDSICYSFDESVIIASKLIDGRDCANNIEQMRKSYSDCKDENFELKKENGMQSVLILKHEDKITEQTITIDKLHAKIENKNKAIVVLVISNALSILLNILR
jgi:hypothetical protein